MNCPRCGSRSYARFYKTDQHPKCVMCSYEPFDVPADIQQEVNASNGKRIISRKDFRYKW